MTPTARCARHPEAPAVDTCQRCGAFVCGECTQIRDEDVFCPGCIPFLDRPPSARAVHALRCAIAVPLLFGVGAATSGLLGVASVLLTLVAPMVAFATAVVLLLREALARVRGEVPSRGWVYAVAWVVTAIDFLLAATAVVLTMAAFPPP